MAERRRSRRSEQQYYGIQPATQSSYDYETMRSDMNHRTSMPSPGVRGSYGATPAPALYANSSSHHNTSGSSGSATGGRAATRHRSDRSERLSERVLEMPQDSAAKFEKGRIQVLQQERVYVQKKTFTKWCNSFLEKAHLQINDLFTDLADGKMLMKLLEIISGESLGRPNKGVLRVQKIENVNRCINFLNTKVRLESIGAEDIVDGNPRLILGLIWTVILRFQIQDIEIELNEEDESGEKKSAKDALLLWCQRRTHGYPHVKIENFSTSWRNGMGFNALIHYHRPDLIDYNNLNPHDHIGNLNNAFNTAQNNLGITGLLDAEDVDVPKPDDKSIMTYVASYYHFFAKMKSEMTGGKRIAKMLGNLINMEKMEDEYDAIVTNLLDWIYMKTRELKDHNFPNNLEGIQQEMIKFKQYITVEKPPKYKERGDIEGQFFHIQMKRKANGQQTFVPPEGKMLHDINRAWQVLEKSEHDRELSLREELIRQERLEQLAAKFERKAMLRESWVNEMTKVLGDQNFGKTTSQVEAALKKHEAISSDIEARKDRFIALTNMAQELYHENYHSRDRVKRREHDILGKWKSLIDLLEKRRRMLVGFSDLLNMFREIEGIHVEMKELEPALLSEDYGKHLFSVEDLLQKHHLVETQMNQLSSRVRALNKQAQPYMKSLQPENQLLQQQLEALNKEFNSLNSVCSHRRAKLEESQVFYRFLADSEEEEAWLIEKIRLVKSSETGNDLAHVMRLLNKHDALEQEMDARFVHCEEMCRTGEQLVANQHPSHRDISKRIQRLQDMWARLRELSAKRKVRLEDAYESQLYYADANETESWMREKMPLVSSEDYGKNEESAKSLLQRHVRVEEEVRAYEDDIRRLDHMAALMTKAASVHKMSPMVPAKRSDSDLADQLSDDDGAMDEEEVMMDVEYQYEVKEKRPKQVMKEVIQERKVPQVKALYVYKGQNMDVKKGEVMILLNKANQDWWSVRQSTGKEGYVPANYVKEIEPKIVQTKVNQPVTVEEEVTVVRTGVRKEPVKRRRSETGADRQDKPNNNNKIRRTGSMRSQANLHFDKENLEHRQRMINQTYAKLCQQAQDRHRNLEGAIKLFRFYRECDNFEVWMTDKELMLKAPESLSENMESVRRQFETLITDMAANSQILNEINDLADEMITDKHQQSDAIKRRQAEINNRWEYLNKLKMEKERSLQGASSIEIFQTMCDELKDWIQEKTNVLAHDDLGKDLSSVQSLQRKHQNLEYEIGPIQDKLAKMNLLANAVRQSYPAEASHVNAREKEIMDMWKALQDKMKERKRKLADAEKEQQFKEGAKDLEEWIDGVKGKLCEHQTPRDTMEAEALLKDHYELKDDMDANAHRFDNVEALGNDILSKAPHDRETQERLAQLNKDQNDISNMWMDKNKHLHDGKELQIFLREADQIDSVTASHEAFLEFDDLGDTVDAVEALFKRHEDFENKLVAQDERIKALSDNADRLISLPHPESQLIDSRRNQVVSRRQKVKQRCQERHEMLLASEAFHEFKRDADELSEWIKEKYHIAADESYREMTQLLPKLQKHQAFEAELKANNDQLQIINETGKALLKDKHYKSPEIRDILRDLNAEWDRLNNRAQDRGEKLRQASRQELFNKELDDAHAKLREMEKLVNSDDVGKDLRGVKDLLKKHQMLEHEMDVHSDNLNDLVNQGRQMAREGHFDSAGILKSVEDFDRDFKALKEPMAQRRQKLEDSRLWHQFNFDADGEDQWIKEHMPAATSTDYGKSLIDTQNLHKKHQKFELELQGHLPILDKVLQQGDALVKARHFARPEIKRRCEDLRDQWAELMEHTDRRKKCLELALQKQKYFADVNDVESWIHEKQQVVNNQDAGRDEDAADKMLTKHKALEAALDTYGGIVKDLKGTADNLMKKDKDGAHEIRKKQNDLESQFADLQGKCDERNQRLSSSKALYQYLREAGELQDWIDDQMVIASSEDYGQDFEHVQEIDKKFAEFRLGIEAGAARFKQCEKLAASLMEGRSPYSATILDKQEQLRESWKDLLEQVEMQAQKLHGAMEIHRFNRDVEDALYRIREKYGSIPDDLGRDIKQVQSYQKKHEAFENELAALEAQLQVLVDDSARLQEAYPGGNAEQIEQQQQIVVENWTILKEKADQRREDLEASLNLFRFLADARDLDTWAAEMTTEMLADQQVQHVGSVDALRKRHQQLKAEIDAREDTFSSVINTGNAMVEGEHFASNDIEAKIEELLDTREKLHGTWQQQKEHLDNVYDQQLFYREAQQLQALSTSQEAYLNAAITADSVEQVEALMKKHEAFEKLLVTQEAKLEALHQHANKLIDSNHFDSDNIAQTLDTVVRRRQNIKRMSEERMQKLLDCLLFQQFNRDATEAESWIDDKLKAVREDSFSGAALDLHDKMRKLQKHQAFEAEIVANRDRIEAVFDLGDKLIQERKHPESRHIQQRSDALEQRWNQLLTVSQNRGKGLEEAKDILKFNEEVDKVEAWIREKDMLVSAGDTGRDYEHCMELQKKLDDVEDGVAVDEDRIQAINNLGEQLLRTPRDDISDVAPVQEKMSNLNNRWRAVQGSIQAHKQGLTTALEVHAFNRDANDLHDRINEKALAVSSDDVGKDLPGVTALQRKHDEVERDMTAIQDQLQKQERQSTALCHKYPNQSAVIQNKQRELQDAWERLEDLANARNIKLKDSFQLHRFLAAAKEHINWCNTMQRNIKSGELAKDVLEADEQLEVHNERKAEIDGRLDHYRSLKVDGEALLHKNHFASADIEEILQQLDTTWQQLNVTWDEHKQLLTQCYDLQIYEEYAEQADSWLSSKEAFLSNEDVGHSISGVDALLKKHSGFEKTLEAQEEKINTLEQLCQALLAQEHYASDRIRARCEGVLERRESLRKMSGTRKKVLEDSRVYQLFLRNVAEVLSWMSSKLQVAMDDSYRDSTNLQGKIQKHQAFEAEVQTNKRRLDTVTAEGNDLIKNHHFASKNIEERLQEIEVSWSNLSAASDDKRLRLSEAYQALLFSRQADDLEEWIDEVEAQLTSEDHGKDISTATSLLKKHQLLEQDIANHRKVHELLEMVREFKEQKHFMYEEMNSRIKGLFERYQSLNEPCQIRRDNLDDALLLYQFYRDVADELSWIQEKLPLATSTNLGNSLTAVQNLQKKHNALESEIVSHVPMVAAVTDTAQHMINNKHYAHQEVSQRLDQLQSELQTLKDAAAKRRAKLLDAVESQMFYSEVMEAENWMKEKLPLLASTDFGTDQDSVLALIKKMDALDLDIDNFHNNIGELAALSQGLVQRKHFDCENIQRKQSEIEQQYRDLQDKSAMRRARLEDNQKLFDFEREADEVIAWMKEREVIASSEDYGTDLEHVQVLQQKFDNFVRDLLANEDRVNNVTSIAERLISTKHREQQQIQQRGQQVEDMWTDVKEQALARQEALAGAQQVHMFVRDTDDAIEWIQEKDLAVSSDNFGHDLESVRDLIVKHEGLAQDLAAISKTVETITSEAERLLGLFPDAKDHIHTKHEEMVQAWETLVKKAKRQREKLQQAEQLQMYFNDYRELLAWCTEMLAVITSDDLARDVSGAEMMINRHNEHKAEIDTRSKDFMRFTIAGEALIQEKHFLSAEIQEKIDHLNSSLDQLNATWNQRMMLYKQNLDLLQLRRDIDQLDTWLNFREAMLHDNAGLGDTIDAVEEQIIKHEDFMKTVEAQGEKFNAIKRKTLLEQAFAEQKQMEQQQRLAEEKRREKQRLDEKMKIEHGRILEERRREQEQRNAQDTLQRRRNEAEDRTLANVAEADKAVLSPKQVANLVSRTPSMKSSRPADIQIRKRDDSDTTSPLASPTHEPAVQQSLKPEPAPRPAPTSMSMSAIADQPKATLEPAKPVPEKRGGLVPSKSDGWAESDVKPRDPAKRDKPKRTLSLKTRSSASFKDKYRLPPQLPPAEMESFLERKQELQNGGKKATIRSWKNFYTVLCGQLLCFFRDRQGFTENSASAPPLVLHHASCEIATDYTKKKNVLRLHLHDGSEYLFVANTKDEMMEWLKKITFYAGLAPSQQLQHFSASHPTSPSHSVSSRTSRTSSIDEVPTPPSPTHSHGHSRDFATGSRGVPPQPPTTATRHTAGGGADVAALRSQFDIPSDPRAAGKPPVAATRSTGGAAGSTTHARYPPGAARDGRVALQDGRPVEGGYGGSRKMSAPAVPPPAPPVSGGGHNGYSNGGDSAAAAPAPHRRTPAADPAAPLDPRVQTLPVGASLQHDAEHAGGTRASTTLEHGIVPPSKHDKKRHSLMGFLKKKHNK